MLGRVVRGTGGIRRHVTSAPEGGTVCAGRRGRRCQCGGAVRGPPFPGGARGRQSPTPAGRGSLSCAGERSRCCPARAAPRTRCQWHAWRCVRETRVTRGAGMGRLRAAAAGGIERGRCGAGRALPAGGTKARGRGAAQAASRCTVPRSPSAGRCGTRADMLLLRLRAAGCRRAAAPASSSAAAWLRGAGLRGLPAACRRRAALPAAAGAQQVGAGG